MATDLDNPKPLRDKLLKANGLSPAGLSNNDCEQMRLLLERRQRAHKKSDLTLIVMWIAVLLLFAACVIGLALADRQAGWLQSTSHALGLTAMLLLYASVYVTIGHWIAGRSLKQREVLYHLMRIEAQLEAGQKLEKTSRPGEDPLGS